MTRMDEHLLLSKKIEGEIFIRTCCGNAKNGVPAGFASEAGACGLRGECFIEGYEVGADSGEELRLELRASGEKHGKRVLDGSVHRKIGVGDDFEAQAGFVFQFFGPGEGDPCGFHLWEATEFGKAAERECERNGVRGE